MLIKSRLMVWKKVQKKMEGLLPLEVQEITEPETRMAKTDQRQLVMDRVRKGKPLLSARELNCSRSVRR